MLTDHNPGDGGFCVVPGSHKSNFKMGNSNSLNKAVESGEWTNNLDMLETIRNELEEPGRNTRRSSKGSKGSKSSRKGNDKIDLNEIKDLHKLITSLQQDEEGQKLLQRFVEQQADLNLDDMPPVADIVVPRRKKKSSGNRAA